MELKTKRFVGRRKNCSCSMPGVWRAVSYCKGIAVIFHSPQSCAHVARSMDINYHYNVLSKGYDEKTEPVPLISSRLEEKHSIFGGIERLKQCIRYVVKKYDPECVVIASSCVAGVIGDDVESAVEAAEKEYNIPFVAVNSYGFLDGEYYEGYIKTAEQIIERFLKPQTVQKQTALLVGDNGGPWGDYATEVTRMLNFMGVEVIGQFPGYIPFKELDKSASAEAVIVLGGRGQINAGLKTLAEKFSKNFGLKRIDDIYPIGWENTKNWIHSVGKLYKCEDKAEKLLSQDEALLKIALRKYLPVTENKKALICVGRILKYFQPEPIFETVKMLKLNATGIVLLKGYSEKEYREISEEINNCSDIKIYNETTADKLFKDANLVLTTHELQDKTLKQIFLPMIPKVGVKGEIGFMETVYRSLCSKNKRGGIRYV